MTPFWGVVFTIPVGKITNQGAFVCTRSKEDVGEACKEYLNEICKPFPILKERLNNLVITFHSKYEWEQEILNQHINPELDIYFCDHEH